MKNNVINLNREIIPNDLMTFKELESKHGYKYGYLYKWACLKKQIPLYYNGQLRISEKDVLNFDRMRVLKKYGRS